MPINQDLKSSVLPKYVELFILDMTGIGGPVYRFTPNTNNGSTSLSFGGQVYTALPITGSGWETSTDGAPPQPVLRVSNVSKFIQSDLTQYDDLVGAKIIRMQTFDKYLDSGATPDSSQIFGVNTYIVEQKTIHNKLEIVFKLTSVIDRPQFKLPRGQVLRAVFPGAGLFRKQ